MTYEQASHWLLNDLVFFQQQGSKAYKPGLERITALCAYLGNPQAQFKSIHIAGTNGKGSTAHMLSAVLQAHNLKVGLHTSPHLLSFGERNKINGENTQKEFITDFVAQHKDFIQRLGCSFFEVAVAMGFSYFAQEKVDVAIIETGLGGRLDATNIIQPEMAIITNIALEHTAILGNTLSQIAYEKAGIIKPQTPIIIGEYLPEIKPVFEQRAKELGAPIIWAQEQSSHHFSTDLLGKYQAKNLQTLSAVLPIVEEKIIPLNNEKISWALQNVAEITNFMGRWQQLGKQPLCIADTAHNPAGFQEIVFQIEQNSAPKKYIILGFVADKDVSQILALLPQEPNFEYIFTQAEVERKMPIEELRRKVPSGLHKSFFETTAQAIKYALMKAKSEDFIFIGGSNFIVSEALAFFNMTHRH
ncbi:bifunctional folylpolyglutamate synthase/dihydrofolate synthase [Ornithobacterium rhinotracheale]|uniref:Dihydrofolate synthase/folylpolyglutamate synthase n=1 Tax=Ornithobacterium rhinotracheale TaxID=28251 RepID=A0A410JPN7_ORNRH|nr:folylpolyglutamate synthase/dihydrofolate synthase family protein [Ornithobacterium rhinotracheale]QAR30092.1 bifunctional folylpolyglutamate synthase/dihydrofolate synthase [Ornithobacterium rhinotracheale]